MNILTPESVYAISNYVLLFIILGTALRYIILSDKSEGRGVHKIIGGLSAFEVALVSRQPFIILVSLFIGGLIIASEEFMHNLVIILKSKSEDIGKNLSMTKASKEEVQEKKQKEIQKLKTITRGKPLKALSEGKVFKYLENNFGVKSQRHIRIESGSNNFVVDGLVESEDKTKAAFVEVKLLRNTQKSWQTIEDTIGAVNEITPNSILFICLITDVVINRESLITILDLEAKYKNTDIFVFEDKKGALTPFILPSDLFEKYTS